ncbi:MAG: hypothetical protein H0T51_21960 [Pirellulales bacterium]|nr:hypothetical protein [Pirellulales bacterium]
MLAFCVPMMAPACLGQPCRADLLLLEAGSNRILRYDDLTGVYNGVFAEADIRTNGSADMVFGPDGNLFVSDTQGQRILRYHGLTGAFLGVFAGAEAFEFSLPGEMAFDPNGDLLVSASNQIRKIDGRTGQSLGVFVEGTRNAIFQRLQFGADGNLYAIERDAHDIKRFNGITGAFIGNLLDGSRFFEPTDFVLDDDGAIFISDYSSGNGLFRYDAGSSIVWDSVDDRTEFINTQPLIHGHLLTISRDGTLLVLNRDPGRETLLRFNEVTGSFIELVHRGGLRALALTPLVPEPGAWVLVTIAACGSTLFRGRW